MKKIVLCAVAALTLIGCAKEMPTISPKEATLYVGDTLQLEVTGKSNPAWIIGSDAQSHKDSIQFVKVLPENKAVALIRGDLSLGFEHYTGHSFSQQVHFVFTKLHILPRPTVLPKHKVMSVGDTLTLEVYNIENPIWEFEYPNGHDADIITFTEDNQVIANKPGDVNIGFYYDSKSDVGPDVRSSFTEISIL